jgi:hypothetical protein
MHDRELPDGSVERTETCFPSATVEDAFKRSQVTVWSRGGGIKFLFDTPKGEVDFCLTEEGWKKLQDIVWQALAFKGPFDESGRELE